MTKFITSNILVPALTLNFSLVKSIPDADAELRPLPVLLAATALLTSLLLSVLVIAVFAEEFFFSYTIEDFDISGSISNLIFVGCSIDLLSTRYCW